MSEPGLTRPRDIQDVVSRLAHFRSSEAALAAKELRSRESDVFVATYSKSGTTWLQQIVHQLRSGASTDFEEISCVVPWLESAYDIGIDPSSEQPYDFRAFKSHFKYSELPKPGRYITVFRNPFSVLSSFFRFFEGWWFERGTVSMDDFANALFLQGSAAGRYWDHLVNWWPQIEAEDTLVLCYEDCLLAPEKLPTVVADFLGLTIDAETMEKVILHASRPYMLAHSHQFDDHVLRSERDKIWGLPPGGGSSKVAAAREPIHLSSNTRLKMEEAWAQTIAPKLGFTTYEEFRAALPNPLEATRP